MTQTEAECFCHDFGGHLVSLHSIQDYRALQQATTLSGYKNAVFIGAYETRENNWVWTDGSGNVDTTADWAKQNLRTDNYGGQEDHLGYCGPACTTAYRMGPDGACGHQACCGSRTANGGGGQSNCVGIHDWGRSDKGTKLGVACSILSSGQQPSYTGPNGR